MSFIDSGRDVTCMCRMSGYDLVKSDIDSWQWLFITDIALFSGQAQGWYDATAWNWALEEMDDEGVGRVIVGKRVVYIIMPSGPHPPLDWIGA